MGLGSRKNESDFTGLHSLRQNDSEIGGLQGLAFTTKKNKNKKRKKEKKQPWLVWLSGLSAVL